jgi:hypothetical protein
MKRSVDSKRTPTNRLLAGFWTARKIINRLINISDARYRFFAT